MNRFLVLTTAALMATATTAVADKLADIQAAGKIVAIAGVPEATAALQNGSCVAFLYDNTWIESQIASNEQWAGCTMPFETENPSVRAIAVPLEDLDGPFGATMSEIVTDWHASGFLIERNAAAGIADSPFL